MLFFVCVNEFLDRFNGYGCRYLGFAISAIMYADDLVLLAPSVSELQDMINVCCAELLAIDLTVNSTKSTALRIGRRHNVISCKLLVSNEPIAWANEAKYLGVYIISGSKFKCCFDKTKTKFYRSANSILCKAGNTNNEAVSVQLMSSIALPILTYAIEALSLNKTELNVLDHPWYCTFQKIFKTFDKDVVRQCQAYTGSLTMHQHYALRAMNFLLSLASSDNLVLKFVYLNSGNEDITILANLYGLVPDTFLMNYRKIILSSQCFA